MKPDKVGCSQGSLLLTNNFMTQEQLAEQLHIWYLEGTKELKPESYNPNAQKAYQELTEEQRYIDRYIAKKILEFKNRE